MLSDFTPIIWEWPERQDITIYPIADVHLGAAEHMEAEWSAFLKRIKGEPNSYVTIGGDVLNNTTRSSVSDIFSETMRPRDQKARMVEMLAPIKDKILCGIMGNHEARGLKDADDDPLYDVFCKLDIEDKYRENGAFMTLRFGNKAGNGLLNPTYQGALIHGAGGGMYVTSIGPKAERMALSIEGNDFLLLGHTHKPVQFPVGKIKRDPFNNTIRTASTCVVVATPWMAYGGYAFRKMYLPSANCDNAMILRGNRKSITTMMTIE